MIGENLSDVENQGDSRSHECMSSGGTNLGWFQGIDPRGGAEFDKNGPNLTEDINFEIGATLFRIKGPEELQSSGIESHTGERSEVPHGAGQLWSMPWPRPMMAMLI